MKPLPAINPRTGERWMRRDELFGKGPRCTKHPRCMAVDGHPGPRCGPIQALRQIAFWGACDLGDWLDEREEAKEPCPGSPGKTDASPKASAPIAASAPSKPTASSAGPAVTAARPRIAKATRRKAAAPTAARSAAGAGTRDPDAE
jgi:hypothetical protein